MSETAAAEHALPVTLTEIRPGRTVAVHTRLNAASKTRVFFVHGSCASMLPYRECIEHVATSSEVIAYDYVGCGRSPKPRSWRAYSYSELKADLAAIIQRYASSSDKRNIIVAHSAGCSLSLAVAADGAGVALTGLCLLGAFAERIPAHPIFYLPVFVLNWLQPTLSAGFEAVALHATTRKGETQAQRQVLALCAELNASNEMHMCKAYYRQMAVPPADDVRRIAAARLPVMLMAGEADALIPLASTSALNSLLPEAEMRVVPSASHQMMQENPGVVCKNVDDFIARVA